MECSEPHNRISGMRFQEQFWCRPRWGEVIWYRTSISTSLDKFDASTYLVLAKVSFHSTSAWWAAASLLRSESLSKCSPWVIFSFQALQVERKVQDVGIGVRNTCWKACAEERSGQNNGIGHLQTRQLNLFRPRASWLFLTSPMKVLTMPSPHMTIVTRFKYSFHFRSGYSAWI